MKNVVYLRHTIQNVVTVTKVVTIYYDEYEGGFRSDGESHDFWELNYADRGSIVVFCDGREHHLSQGEMIVLPPNQYHYLATEDDKPSNAFIISFEAQSSFLNLIGGGVFRMTPAMKELIQSIASESERGFQLPMPRTPVRRLADKKDALLGSQQIVRMRLEELLICMLRAAAAAEEGDASNDLQIFTSKARFDDCIAEQILEILKENVYSQLTLPEITARLGYGKTYLCGIFKKVYGSSIMTCFTKLKIDEAKYLLREGVLTVAQISDKLGFSSPQYFTRRFTQSVHMSPKQYALSIHATWVDSVDSQLLTR